MTTSRCTLAIPLAAAIRAAACWYFSLNFSGQTNHTDFRKARGVQAPYRRHYHAIQGHFEGRLDPRQRMGVPQPHIVGHIAKKRKRFMAFRAGPHRSSTSPLSSSDHRSSRGGKTSSRKAAKSIPLR